jgi:uncharacterized protein YbjT (DUF2867 family)
MSHLIPGGTGTAGSPLGRVRLARGESGRVLTRSAERAKAVPAGATTVIGDLADPTTYGAIFPGATTVFLLNALSTSELQEGLCALAEAKKQGVKRLVYQSVTAADSGIHVPHFATKVAIEAAIKASGIPYTILRPNNYFQNDLAFLEVITKYGAYPAPLGSVGVSRVDVRDIADAAANALTASGHANRTYALVGPEALTGESSAAAWTKGLGREVRYAGDDLEAWAASMAPHLPAWLIYDLRLMFALFQAKGLAATKQQLAETIEVVGAPPRAYAAYIAETVASLKGTAASS